MSPSLNFDAEISLDQVNPELFQAVQRLQPFGVGNPQPVFVTRGVRLVAPPRVLKEKHVKLKLAVAENRERQLGTGETKSPSTLLAGTWPSAVSRLRLRPGDHLDIAFTIDNNDHPEYGGLELSIRDFKSLAKGDDEGR